MWGNIELKIEFELTPQEVHWLVVGFKLLSGLARVDDSFGDGLSKKECERLFSELFDIVRDARINGR